MATTQLCFDRLTEAEPGAVPGQSSDRPRTTAGGKQLLCRRCANPITRISEQIQVNGAHQHRRSNPAGQSFHIGCFRDAPGCVLDGPSWRQHSWFPDYRWTVALCSRCGGHLGWHFQAGDRFFGLILDQLRPAG